MKKVVLSQDAKWVGLLQGLLSLLSLEVTGAKGVVKAATKQQLQEQQKFIAGLYANLLHFLQQHLEEDDAFLQSAKGRASIAALMEFIREGKKNLEKYTNWFSRGSGFSCVDDLAEYRDLMEYYASAIEPHLPKELSEEIWEQDWDASDLPLASEKEGVLQSVSGFVEDGNFELMLLLEKSGCVLFDYDFLHHCRMLYELKDLLKDEVFQDQQTKLALIFDRQVHLLSVGIIKDVWEVMQEFFSFTTQLKDSSFIKDVSAAVIALMLAGNPRNLKQSSLSSKCCIDYYQDFQHYLRKVVAAEEYQRLLSASSDARPFHVSLSMLIDKLSFAFFTEFADDKDLAAFIQRIAYTGGYREDDRASFAGMLKNIDVALRKGACSNLLAAIAYIDKMFSLRQVGSGFDPLSQGSVPRALFSFTSAGRQMTCLKMPAPLHQRYLSKAEITEEFKAFLQALSHREPKERILFINFQKRTSLYEHARCIALEALSQQAPFSDTFSLIGLAVCSDFYHQRGEYEAAYEYTSFMQIVVEHILGGSDYGFFMPEQLHKKLEKQLIDIITLVGDAFFHKQKTLSHQMRCCFIDLCYWFIIAFAAKEEKVGFISFIDKDGTAKASSMNAAWYCFCKMMQGYLIHQQDLATVLSLCYGPGLCSRGQLLHEEHVMRMISTLTQVEEMMPNLKKGLLKNAKGAFFQLGLV